MRCRAPAVGVVALVLTVGTAACGDEGSTSSSTATLSVVATTTQLADFARVVGGAHVDVYGVLKANVDAHDYEPSPADLTAVASADVIVMNGVGLEAWLDDTIDSADPRGTIVDASADVEVRDDDPHIWLDPTNAARMVATVAGAFGVADAEHARDYERRAADYVQELAALDAEIQADMDALPDKRVVTNHDAFGYFAAHFGLEIVGAVIPSFDSQAELSAGDITALVDAIRATGVRAVFAESSLPADAARTIAEEAGVEVVDGDDALYADTLGPEGSGADTYLGMMRHNARTIVDHLG